MHQSKDEEEKALGAKAFYAAMEIIGYETAIYEGKSAFYIEMDRDKLMEELSIVLENIYITMLVLAIKEHPKKDDLYTAKRFVNSMNEFLQSVTTETMIKIIDEDEEVKNESTGNSDKSV